MPCRGHSLTTPELWKGNLPQACSREQHHFPRGENNGEMLDHHSQSEFQMLSDQLG